MKKLMLLTAAAVAISAPAVAQDYGQSPAYGTLTLSSGFTPDPRTVRLVSGGGNDASSVASGCVGNIAYAPDVRLHCTNNGTSLPLIFSTQSDHDTTLVINGPDGRWYCDDDSGGGLNPSIQLPARSGRYEVWVGTYRSGSLASSPLAISELYSN